MVDAAREDSEVVDLERRLGDLGEATDGRHRAHVHRKIGIGHLPLQRLLERSLRKVERVEAELVSLVVKRKEKRQSLDMIPMVMTDQDMSENRPAAEFLHKRLSEHPHAGAAVDDEQRSRVRAELQARCIAAVSEAFRLWGGDGAADSPELQPHKVRSLYDSRGITTHSDTRFGHEAPREKSRRHGARLPIDWIAEAANGWT